MDEFRSRVISELNVRGMSKRQASLDAGLSSSALTMLLNDPELTPKATTVSAFAHLFGWSEIEAMQQAGLIRGDRTPAPQRDPLHVVAQALNEGPWSAEARQTLIALARQLLPQCAEGLPPQLIHPAPPAIEADVRDLVDEALDGGLYTRWDSDTRHKAYAEIQYLKGRDPHTWADEARAAIHKAATTRRAAAGGPLRNHHFEVAFLRSLRKAIHNNPNVEVATRA